MEVPERNAIVSGIGISRVGRKTGIPGPELTEESCRAAIADAGLTVADIDGMATMGDTPLDEAAATLGVDVPWRGGTSFHGGLISPVLSACLAVAAGEARHVLIYRTVQMIGGTIVPGAGGGPAPAPPPSAPAEGMAQAASVMGDMMWLLSFHAYSAANWLAMHCRRHMHLYGTTKEQLGALAVNSRRYAALNPRAAYQAPITMDDYLAARPISEPFGLLDCDVPVDGSIALVISTADHAAGCPNPVRVEAFGGASGPGTWDQRADYPKMASVDAAAELWSRTDLTPADVDLAELYDGFTFITLAWLEALGFCGDGEAGPFLEGGARIALDGELPLNTFGGQLSAGRMHGYWYLHEACLQLRGEAGERQVPRHEVAVAAVGGGPFAGCLLLTR